MWEEWIGTYGYIVVFLGCLVEGETILLLAGYSLSRGYLDPIPTFLLAVAGATAGDSLYYWIGRRFGTRVLRALPALRPARARAALFLRRWGRTAALLARFAYGIRSAILLLMGASRTRVLTFHSFDLAGAIAFATIYVGLGFLFGAAIQQMLDRVRPYESRIILFLVLCGLLLWTIREWRLYRSLPPDVERRAVDQDGDS